MPDKGVSAILVPPRPRLGPFQATATQRKATIASRDRSLAHRSSIVSPSTAMVDSAPPSWWTHHKPLKSPTFRRYGPDLTRLEPRRGGRQGRCKRPQSQNPQRHAPCHGECNRIDTMVKPLKRRGFVKNDPLAKLGGRNGNRLNKGRNRITSGSAILDGINGRTKNARRFRDLCKDYGEGLDRSNAIVMTCLRLAATATMASETLAAKLIRGERADPRLIVRLQGATVRSLRAIKELAGENAARSSSGRAKSPPDLVSHLEAVVARRLDPHPILVNEARPPYPILVTKPPLQ
jgi:hypothetical protein